MPLSSAKRQFKQIVLNLNQDDQFDFLEWINEEYKNELEGPKKKSAGTLDKISTYLKKKYPFGKSFSPDEKIQTSVSGASASSNLLKTIEIDEFLFDDDDVKKFAEKGLIKKHYCKDCASDNIEQYHLITHSVSKEILYELFDFYLDSNLLKDKKVLDIGSRIGAFLYGCYFLGPNQCEITGIEMNKDLCSIQQEIIEKFKLGNRVKVINKDVMNCAEIVSESDVIFLHNVFEFFAPDDVQVKIWKFLKKNIKKNAILVTIPSMQKMTENLFQENFLDNWLIELISNKSTICMYQVV